MTSAFTKNHVALVNGNPVKQTLLGFGHKSEAARRKLRESGENGNDILSERLKVVEVKMQLR